MTTREAIELLELHNKWRRDETGIYKMQSSTEIGIAIDVLIKKIKDYEKDKRQSQTN